MSGVYLAVDAAEGAGDSMTAPDRTFVVWPHRGSAGLAFNAQVGGQVRTEYVRADIAADLLAALKVAQLWLDVDGRFDMQGINAAIAKAEGGAA